MAGSKKSKGRRPKQEKSVADDNAAASDAGAGTSSDESSSSGVFSWLSQGMGHSRVNDMTLWEILTTHPLVNVGKFVLIPYLLYIGYYYIPLQHPEYISNMTGGLIKLRPAVYGTDTPRQLLIVATPGSGTVQIASELRKKLSLEIGHESTDAAWDFTRDGSVSWIHGMRFMTPPKDDTEKVQAIAKICNSDIDTHENMGFHPAMYGPPRNNCSYRSKWDECWKAECFVTLLKEWGCGFTDTCEIKFTKNVHQVRNPMNTLESLVVKYCIGGVDGIVADPFLVYASALFPSHEFSADSCIEATGSFVVLYQDAMIKARTRGVVDAFYQIEKSSACDVAKAAGLLAADTTVYEPNYIRIDHICDKENNTNSPAQQIVEKKLNEVNKNQEVQLGWMDLRGGIHGSTRKDGDKGLEGLLRNLFTELNYDATLVPLQYKPIDAHSEF